jgi:hypothetical protein
MPTLRQPIWCIVAAYLVFLLSACGGGGGGTATSPNNPVSPALPGPSSNVIPISVDSQYYGGINIPYVSVTICSPVNPTLCQTIDHITVDTGSSGLRILASAISPALSNFPQQTTIASGGNPVAECMPYALGYTWGSIRFANIQIGSETVGNLAIQVISDPAVSTIPSACSGLGNPMNTGASLGSNGLLGVGLFAQDCGSYCASGTNNQVYYGCSPSGCNNILQTTANQLQQPVSLFSKDNNGVIIAMNPISTPLTGQQTASGTLTFGIDTQTNNASTNTNTLTADPTSGYISTTFNNQLYPNSLMDTGSNAYFFTDSAIPSCATSGSRAAPGFYCPTSVLPFSAVATGVNNTSTTINFAVANVANLYYNSPSSYAAFANLAGSGGTGTGAYSTFDWGLPFFYGRQVYVAIEGSTTSKGVGPYFGW